jgi:Putative RNA methylase family UPF0020
VLCDWNCNAAAGEATLHQLSPYVGKLKSTIAASLVRQFTTQGETIYDPFVGCGTVALEGWIAGRNVIANDLNEYALLLSRAKLFPYLTVDAALSDIDAVAPLVQTECASADLQPIPLWVRQFYHPETLREIMAWISVLRANRKYFLLACLLGILHHQRPGFLSYPSSHTVPYLRSNSFPREVFPELYNYRSVRFRLEAKVRRAFKRLPKLDRTIRRACFSKNAATFCPSAAADAIITSPPYMSQLDYARDNRLRLWFLGVSDIEGLDKRISPHELEFLALMRNCLKIWRRVLAHGSPCVLVLGDTESNTYNTRLPSAIARIAVLEIKGYAVAARYTETIPVARRVRRNCRGSVKETVLVLKRC